MLTGERGAIQLLIAESAYGRCRSTAVGCQQRERGCLADAVILLRVVAIHLLDGVPSHRGDWPAGSEQTC